eukprot:TRINITY_DN16146_c0_g1_i2.p1 TRINITY_DN16146_c0_g1~~TRINITY_DN16146_c0_g1_i2.p1  ORF type:complete len:217 (+),score=34.70 TRINITY_DN16146_c0_g1_i2:220-870(+)
MEVRIAAVIQVMILFICLISTVQSSYNDIHKISLETTIDGINIINNRQRKLLQGGGGVVSEVPGIEFCGKIVNHDAVQSSSALEKGAELGLAFYRAQQRSKCKGGELVVEGGQAGGNQFGLVQACQSKFDTSEYRMFLNATVDCQTGKKSDVEIVYLDARVRLQPLGVSSIFSVDPSLYLVDDVKLGVGKLSIFDIQQPEGELHNNCLLCFELMIK